MIPFIDLSAQQQRIRLEIDARIKAVLDHGAYIMGPEIRELEQRLADYVGVKHALSCASGTDALLMALMAYGVGPGDAIFTTPFTFVATVEVIVQVGATPVFVDIEADTFNMDPAKLDAAIQALSSGDESLHPLPVNYRELKPRGIIPVDLFGQPADYDRINAIAKQYDLFVLEDACQSFGGELNGRKACSLADVAATSFFPAKPLGCYGDGGMVFTDSDELAEKMSSIRVHGQGRDKYENVRIGINGRMDTIQAAIMLPKFEIFPGEVELRQNVAMRYKELLGAVVEVPEVRSGYLSAWAQYSVQSDERAAIMAKLGAAGIPTAIYYPIPLHLQVGYGFIGYRVGDMPISERAAERIFSLPMHPYLAELQQRAIADALRD